MADAVHIQSGESIDYTPGGAVAIGDVVVQGELVGVAVQAIAAGELGALCIDGVFDFTKTAGGSTAFTVGQLMYWDVADSDAQDTADSGTNKLIGKCVKAASDDDVLVRIKLSQ